MATLADISQKLLPNHFFHLFNRGINGQITFYKRDNYTYFLKKYAEKTKAYLDTYAYCLLPNHFHFLVQIKSVDTILLAAGKEYLRIPKALQKELVANDLIDFPTGADMPNFENLAYLNILSFLEKQSFTYIAKQSREDLKNFAASWVVSNQLRKLFLGYSKAINKQENRNGSLMQKPFRRKLVDDECYMIWLIWYVHRNSLHHGVSTHFQNYPYSSYRSHLSQKPTLLKRTEVLKYFGGKANFIQHHVEAAKEWEKWQKYVME